jgi:hypothetical protein
MCFQSPSGRTLQLLDVQAGAATPIQGSPHTGCSCAVMCTALLVVVGMVGFAISMSVHGTAGDYSVETIIDNSTGLVQSYGTFRSCVGKYNNNTVDKYSCSSPPTGRDREHYKLEYCVCEKINTVECSIPWSSFMQVEPQPVSSHLDSTTCTYVAIKQPLAIIQIVSFIATLLTCRSYAYSNHWAFRCVATRCGLAKAGLVYMILGLSSVGIVLLSEMQRLQSAESGESGTHRRRAGMTMGLVVAVVQFTVAWALIVHCACLRQCQPPRHSYHWQNNSTTTIEMQVAAAAAPSSDRDTCHDVAAAAATAGAVGAAAHHTHHAHHAHHAHLALELREEFKQMRYFRTMRIFPRVQNISTGPGAYDGGSAFTESLWNRTRLSALCCGNAGAFLLFVWVICFVLTFLAAASYVSQATMGIMSVPVLFSLLFASYAGNIRLGIIAAVAECKTNADLDYLIHFLDFSDDHLEIQRGCIRGDPSDTILTNPAWYAVQYAHELFTEDSIRRDLLENFDAKTISLTYC